MDAHCRIELLGELRVRQGEQVITRFRTHKAAALLAYLALHSNRAHARERLIDLFWADMDINAGRDNLSAALSSLRRQLEPPGVPAGAILIADRQQVRLNPDLISTDVRDFDRLLDAASAAQTLSERAQLLEQAVALYRGEPLPGNYADWAIQEQTRCAERFADALERWSETLERLGKREAALEAALRATRADPYREEAYQAAMRLYAALGRSAEALATFQTLEKTLEDNLGIAPSSESRKLAERIRLEPDSFLTERPETPELPHTPVTPKREPVPSMPQVTDLRPLTLPFQMTRFFGRERELAELETLLRDPQARLVTLMGPGGTGKTRLAIESAHRLASSLSNRVWFVPLANVVNPGLISTAILNAMQIALGAGADPLERVVEALKQEPSLLVLDNFEHLLRVKGAKLQGGIAIVRLLLQRAPNVTCLVTSRIALNVSGEQEYPLPSLALPDASLNPTVLMSCSSVALYADRARAAKPDFAVTTQNAQAVATLCRKLEGMPLALEMAAAWAKMMPPSRMVERLERQLDLLVSRRGDLPSRHQSLRATIEWSYDLLAPEQREVFAQLSVFRGGWTLEAAVAVCGERAQEAALTLQEQSLLTVHESEDGEMRYRMLEPLREFAQEKLVESGREREIIGRHVAYFQEKTAQAKLTLHGPEEAGWMKRLQADADNIRAALRACLAPDGDIERGLLMTSALWWYWYCRGYLTEGRQWSRLAMESHSGEPTPAYIDTMNGAGALALDQGDLEEAFALLKRSVEMAEAAGETKRLMAARNNLAIVAYDSGDHAMARWCWEENLKLQRGDAWEQFRGSTLDNLGEMDYDAGDYESARIMMEEALTIRRKYKSHNYLGRNLMLLGKVARCQGRYAEAQAYLAESATLLYEMGVKPSFIETCEAFAGLRVTTKDYAAAACLLAYADSARQAETIARPPNETLEYNAYLNAIRAALDSPTLAACQERGRAFSAEEAVAFALSKTS